MPVDETQFVYVVVLHSSTTNDGYQDVLMSVAAHRTYEGMVAALNEAIPARSIVLLSIPNDALSHEEGVETFEIRVDGHAIGMAAKQPVNP